MHLRLQNDGRIHARDGAKRLCEDLFKATHLACLSDFRVTDAVQLYCEMCERHHTRASPPISSYAVLRL